MDRCVVELPLRIDLAGGWSDTPPICVENGGCVLNAAVTLEGKRPVKAEVERIDAEEVRVISADLERVGVIRNRKDIYGRQDPNDWCALVKSALFVTDYEFSQGGLFIRISADVPKGSGMGTSSILGAALVKALLTVKTGKAPDWQTVSEKTLALEQKMETGGGWQDQMGALVPGVKLVSSSRGARQKCRVKTLSESATRSFARFLRERGVLYFTGQKRMARNVLQGVIRFYKRNPGGVADKIVKALKKDARDGFKALEDRDYPTFAKKVDSYWLNKKALDPGSTNPEVESIIARIAPFMDAVTLCGAGGGGFLFAVAKSAAAKRSMKKVLESAGNGGRCYDFALES